MVQGREETANQILDELFIEMDKPVDADEVLALNERWQFDCCSVPILLETQDAINREKYGDDWTPQSRNIEWLCDFSRYQDSDQWKQRANNFIERLKLNQPLVSPLVNLPVKVIKDVVINRSHAPKIGEQGIVIGGELRIDSRNPHLSAYYHRVEFLLPLRLVDNEMLVSEAQLDPDDNMAIDMFLTENEVEAVWWAKDHARACVILLKADEIKVIVRKEDD